jgi:hypothetical protein
MAREWMYKSDQATIYPLDDVNAGFIPGKPPPPTPFTPVWWVGASSSNTGINASPAQKRVDLLQLCTDIAANSGGKSAAFIRSNMMYHAYNPGINWDASTEGSFQWCKQNGFKGIVMNQKPGDFPGWAAGVNDNNFRNYLQSIKTFMSVPGFKTLVVIEHEPENITSPTVTYGNNWAQGTARFMKLTYEFGDPNIIYATAYIPSGGNGQRAWFNPRPWLDQLCGGDLNLSQTIMDATLCGMDNYPEVNADGSLETIQTRCGAGITDWKSWGFSRFYCPEVAFFNWIEKNNASAGLTPAQQAARLKAQLWTYAKANGFEGYCYYDIGDGSGGRTDSRKLNTSEEFAVYANLCQNIAP